MDGVIAKVSTNGTFTITTDGTFTSTSQQSGDTMTGHISSSGTLVMGQTTVRGSSVGYPANNNAPEVVVAVKNGGTFSNASIAGSYTLIDYSHQYSGEYQCGVGTLTLSSNGTYTTAFTGNTDGVIAKASISGTYTVTADGAFTTTSTQWGDTFTGRISSSGVIVEAQTTVKGSVPAHPDNNCPEITVAVKNGGATFSNASVAGTYTLIDYAHQFPTTQNPAGQYQDAVGTMTLNSNGTYTAAFTANMDGVIGQASTSGTYTIAADGTYTSTSKDSGDTMTGRISSSGVMVAAQTTVRGSTPGFPSDNNAPEFIVGLRNEGTLTPASKNLVGGVGNDIMSGAAGNDTIVGGGGVSNGFKQ